MPYAALGSKIPAGYPDPQAIVKRAKVNFNADLSEDRYSVVHSLFDQTITFRLKELQAATKAIQAAEARLAASGKPNPQAAELIKQARDLAYTPVVTASLASQPDFLKLFSSNKKEVGVSKQITGLEESWNRTARENYGKAVELAQQGRYDEAIGHYREAITMRPDYAEARNNLARPGLMLRIRQA